MPALNLRGLLGECCGRLGWSPREFWQAQHWEVDQALRHHYQKLHEQREWEARKSAFEIQEMASAFASAMGGKTRGGQRWKPPKPSDLYDGKDLTREAQIRAEQARKVSEEEAQQEREELKDLFPTYRDAPPS